MEIHVLLEGARLPDRAAWQRAVDALGLPIILDGQLNVRAHSGYVPCKLEDAGSGFELLVEGARSVLEAYPTLEDAAGSRGTSVSLRWSGALDERACALGVAAALVAGCGGIAYFPDEDRLYTLAELRSEFEQCLEAC